MSDPVHFLNAFAQALGVMTLYPEGHPSRERAVDAAFSELNGITSRGAHPSFTFLDDEVVFGRERLRELKSWDWGKRLVAAGVQRLEFEREVTRDEFEGFLQEILGRLMLSSIDTSEARQMRSLGIRFGAVGLQGQEETGAAPAPLEMATLDVTLGEEAETFRWLQNEVQSRGSVPLLEAEAVVRSLSVAMHGDSRIVLPLLKLKEFDQYTTTHALNVSVLSMGLAEFMGLSPREVRAYGVAGMLHDLGKVRVPKDILTKPGKLTPEEWSLMRSHTVEGARLILQSDQKLDVAALVAFEHHIMINGGGYPDRHFRCDCHKASTLVHVCDVYDALRTKRPYRDAWEPAATLEYIERGVGTEFDADVATAFIAMMGKWEPRLAYASLSPAAA